MIIRLTQYISGRDLPSRCCITYTPLTRLNTRLRRFCAHCRAIL